MYRLNSVYKTGLGLLQWALIQRSAGILPATGVSQRLVVFFGQVSVDSAAPGHTAGGCSEPGPETTIPTWALSLPVTLQRRLESPLEARASDVRKAVPAASTTEHGRAHHGHQKTVVNLLLFRVCLEAHRIWHPSVSTRIDMRVSKNQGPQHGPQIVGLSIKDTHKSDPQFIVNETHAPSTGRLQTAEQ